MNSTGGHERAQRVVTALRDATLEIASNETVGVDAVHIPSCRRRLEVGGQRLLVRIYRPAELADCGERLERLATRFAAKEAVLKVLGTGMRGVALRDVEIVSDTCGAPSVKLHGQAAAVAEAAGILSIGVSLCHEDDLALAVAIGIRR